MPLQLEEIAAGVVAYFDVSILNKDVTVTKPTSLTSRSGPFLCFVARDGTSGWAAISTQWRKERLLIDKAWRVDGMGEWLDKDQYLNDGSTTYVGPNAAFVAASQHQDRQPRGTRPRVTAEGVAAVLAEISTRGGNVP